MIEDREGQIIEVNQVLCQMTDFKKEELEGYNVLDKFVLPKYKELARQNIRRIIRGEDLEFDIETPKKNGEIIYKYLKETNIILPNGEKGIISMHLDITDRKAMEKELKEKNILLNSILESIQDGICVLNPDLTIRYTNTKMDEWYYQGLPLKGKKCFEGFYNKNQDCPDCPVLKSLESKKMESAVKKLPTSHELDYIEIFSYPIFDEEEQQITGIVEFVRDISERKEKEREIKYLLYRDSLTGLYNRRFFEEEMKRLDTQRQLPISLIMADVNGLKIINDCYGHDTGDMLLKKAAAILKSTVREEDILARQGGDEFAILLPNTTEVEVRKVLNRIKAEIAASDEVEIPLSIALGQATKTESEEELSEVLKKADNRMYQNKLSVSRSSKSKIVQGLLNILEAKSSETKEHAVRMTKLAFDFGERLSLSNSELNRLSLLATLHDIGKTNINQNILNKPSRLNKREWEIMKNHSEQGYKIASSSEEFALVADDIFAHHEHWDGNGYPRQLLGEDIPYLARIITIIDAFDVMTHDQPYSKAITVKKALQEIESCAGSQFDPELAAAFIALIKN
jgi:diguanylate cyclase (GGDEF)-like protein/PAS domain S-box-containing protein